MLCCFDSSSFWLRGCLHLVTSRNEHESSMKHCKLSSDFPSNILSFTRKNFVHRHIYFHLVFFNFSWSHLCLNTKFSSSKNPLRSVGRLWWLSWLNSLKIFICTTEPQTFWSYQTELELKLWSPNSNRTQKYRKMKNPVLNNKSSFAKQDFSISFWTVLKSHKIRNLLLKSWMTFFGYL